jgi:hypothetical protein
MRWVPRSQQGSQFCWVAGWLLRILGAKCSKFCENLTLFAMSGKVPFVFFQK